MYTQQSFFLCRNCFRIAENCENCHGENMVLYDAVPAGHRQLKPLTSATGRLRSPAPRWFLAQTWPQDSILATIYKD